jgi:hypothetical protein
MTRRLSEPRRPVPPKHDSMKRRDVRQELNAARVVAERIAEGAKRRWIENDKADALAGAKLRVDAERSLGIVQGLDLARRILGVDR